ncbi:MAG TPA: DNA/RNA nuclease SfsA [Clostridiales bacterium]|jgi:sugar fermentation stimulation protein A|nr:DNA/RNA nuclease SfsA [Clostridiales bacterium]
MHYPNTQTGFFLSRPNRFVALVDLNGETVVCHVKNTGRCKELLIPGAKVVIQPSQSKGRKTPFTLLAVYKGDRLVNIDSQIPNHVFAKWVSLGNLFPSHAVVRPEWRHGDSRFDFLVTWDDKKALVEVKGVTLEEEGVALFPDAPTERGVRHLTGLAAAVADGFDAYAVFIIQMKGVQYFAPNEKMHPAFANALKDAQNKGVTVLALDCDVTEDSITARSFVPVCL